MIHDHDSNGDEIHCEETNSNCSSQRVGIEVVETIHTDRLLKWRFTVVRLCSIFFLMKSK